MQTIWKIPINYQNVSNNNMNEVALALCLWIWTLKNRDYNPMEQISSFVMENLFYF